MKHDIFATEMQKLEQVGLSVEARISCTRLICVLGALILIGSLV